MNALEVEYSDGEILQRLKQLMRKPQYWRDRDPELVDTVTRGFQALYDEPANDPHLSEARKGQLANIIGLNGKRQKEDSDLAHLTPGEIIVPLSHQTPTLMRAIRQEFGDELATYTVGSGKEQRNPESGLAAFADRDEQWFYQQVVGGAKDMWENYQDMKEANTIGADKYFHCKGNFDASSRGTWGEGVAHAISDFRERYQDNFGEGNDSESDQFANRIGRERAEAGKYKTGKNACSSFRPKHFIVF